MSRLCFALLFTVITAFTHQARAVIVWDQGPDTGDYGGIYVNRSDRTNYADKVIFRENTVVDGLNYFTSVFDLSARNGDQDFRIKIFSGDFYEFPETLLFSESIGFNRFTKNLPTKGNATGNFDVTVDMYEFSFTPFEMLADTVYLVGLSGNGFDAGQATVLSPQDGKMAQLSGDNPSSETDVGDQMFQLTATSRSNPSVSVPVPASLALFAIGGACFGMSRIRLRVR